MDAARQAGIAALRRAFGNMDEDVLAAVLEMHNNDSRLAMDFLQGGDAGQPAYDITQLNRMAEHGLAADFPLPAGGADEVLRAVRLRETAARGQRQVMATKLFDSNSNAASTNQGSALMALTAAARATTLKGLFVGDGADEVLVGAHYICQKTCYREYVAVLYLLLRGNVEIIKSARPRILAAAWARGDRTLPNDLLKMHTTVFQLPHVLSALQLLDSARQVRALEKKLRRLEAHNASRQAAKQALVEEFRRRAKAGEAGASAAKRELATSSELSKGTSKTKVTTILKIKKDIEELQREIKTLQDAAGGAGAVGGVSGALQRHIQRWARTLSADQLTYLSLSMPPEPWQQLADLVHLSSTRDFAVDWFLPRAFGKAAPADSAVAIAERIVSGEIQDEVASGKIAGVIGDVLADLCLKHKIPYNYLRMQMKPVPGPVKVAVSRYTLIDTCIWFHEELVSDGGNVARSVNGNILARLLGEPMSGTVSDTEDKNDLKPELPKFGYGKLMERLLYFLQTEGGTDLAEALIPLAEQRLALIARELQLDAPVVVLGDASYSMDVAIRTATVIGSVIAAAAKAELKFFTNKCVDPKVVPTTVRQCLEVTASVRADGQTAPAAALWPYFEQKKIVRCFVVVTDEIENDKYRAPDGQSYWFAPLFARYRAEVYPAQLVFVSFLDDPSDANKLGRMVAACEHLGITPNLTFKLDARRPDLQKLDTILGLLQAETAAFPRLVQRLASGTDDKQIADNNNLSTSSSAFDSVISAFDALRVSGEDAVRQVDGNDNVACSQAEDRTRPDTSKVCVICEENTPNTVLLNCGHAMFCSVCAEKVMASGKECPVCRSPVERTLRIFQ